MLSGKIFYQSKVRASPDGGDEGVAERGQGEAAPALTPSPRRLRCRRPERRRRRAGLGQGQDLQGVQGAGHLRGLSHGHCPVKELGCDVRRVRGCVSRGFNHATFDPISWAAEYVHEGGENTPRPAQCCLALEASIYKGTLYIIMKENK